MGIDNNNELIGHQAFRKGFSLPGVSYKKFNEVTTSLYFAFNDRNKIDNYFTKKGSRSARFDDNTSIYLVQKYLHDSIHDIYKRHGIAPKKIVQELGNLVNDRWFGKTSAPKLSKENDVELLESTKKTLKKTIAALWKYWDCTTTDESMEYFPVDIKELAAYLDSARNLIDFSLSKLKDNGSFVAPSKHFHRHQFVGQFHSWCKTAGHSNKEICSDLYKLLQPLQLFKNTADGITIINLINSDLKQYRAHPGKKTKNIQQT